MQENPGSNTGINKSGSTRLVNFELALFRYIFISWINVQKWSQNASKTQNTKKLLTPMSIIHVYISFPICLSNLYVDSSST